MPDPYGPHTLQFYVAFFRCAIWEESRPLFPRKCCLSGKWLWLKPVMKWERKFRDVNRYENNETYWVDSEELMLFKLRYN